ncbi:MAG: ABC transporter permease subunit [Planctomycetota bacterium]|jgi:ABC-type transport system involved in multi-copper enzyme maturation permease subunit
MPVSTKYLLNVPDATMAFRLNDSVVQFASLSWLTGPIFDKELRVSSRRRRNYILRFAYLALLMVFLVVVWLEETQNISVSGIYSASRMARAGKTIIMTIVWFQFCVTQFLAVIMLSTSINDEIYNRTLGVLMTTPITSFQIVMGKLSSKLLQLILLLAISLPLLAIVRVFGGVPWVYVISSLCITLTTVIFAGSVSLFFSIFSRRAYIVIILTVLALGILFGLFWFLPTRIFGFYGRGRQLSAPVAASSLLNPYMLLAVNTDTMLNPKLTGAVSFLWPVHCGVMLAASAAVLFACVRLVRKIALAQTIGGAGVFARLWRARPTKPVKNATEVKSAGRIRRVKGPPIIWKELISRRSSREKLFVMTIIGVQLVMIAAMYLFPYIASATSLEEAHAGYIGIFLGLGALSVTVFSATCIASEKEARSWPLLLTTTVSDWEIIFGKLVGVMRRSLPVWVMLMVYLIPFWSILAFGVLDVAVLVIGTTVFLCGTGFYVSSRLRRTSAAVAANFVLAASVWGILHLSLASLELPFRPSYRRELLDCFWDTIPYIQAMETVWSRRRPTQRPMCWVISFSGFFSPGAPSADFGAMFFTMCSKYL